MFSLRYIILAVLISINLSSSQDRTAPAVKKCNDRFKFGRYVPFNSSLKPLISPNGHPINWEEAEEQCDVQYRGYNLLQQDFLDSKQLAPCSIIPLGIINTMGTSFWKNGRGIGMEEVNTTYRDRQLKPVPSLRKPKNSTMFGALHVANKTWWLVDSEFKFQCAMCQRLSRENNQIFDPVFPRPPLENPVHVYQVHWTTNSSNHPNLKTLEKKVSAKLENVFQIRRENIVLENLEGVSETKLVFRMYSNDSIKNVKRFEGIPLEGDKGSIRLTQIIDLNMCPEEITVEGSGHSFKWPQTYVNYVAIVYEPNTDGLIKVTRECAYDFSPNALRARWTDARFWEDAWVKCWRNENQLGIDEEIESTSVTIHNFSRSHVDSSQLEYVADLAIRGLRLYFGDPEDQNYTTRLNILQDFQLILTNMVLEKSIGDYVKVDRMQVNFLVSDIGKKNPVAGFMMTYRFYYFFEITESSIAPVRQQATDNIPEPSCVAVVFCDAIVRNYDRAAFGVYTNFHNLFPKGSLKGIFQPGKRHPVNIRIAIQILFATKRNQSRHFDRQLFFDVYIQNRFAHLGYQTRSSFWDDSTNDWTSGACFRLKSTRGNKDVFRCNRLNLVNNTLEGKYILYFTPFEFSDFLQSNELLWYLMVLIASLSLTSLISIIVTAAAIKRWREDLGHKILLHMMGSLASNLLLGLLNNFVSFDTKSYGCIVVGVARHYFYLAMFAWMLVLSALQLKRLLTFVGAKTTNYLLLKVSLFAWGVPTLIVGTLLVWDTGFYQSTYSDRGFCYPEGIAFEITVQAPAAVSLFLVGVIFVAILARVFSCFGWGRLGDHLVRHGIGKKTLQLRRLQTSLFLFFLLGLTWIFHFLAEEGVINNKFFFEYMFLLTASTHVFILSLFFVFFDKATRGDWALAYRRLKERSTDLKESVEERFANVSKRVSQCGKGTLGHGDTKENIAIELTSTYQ